MNKAAVVFFVVLIGGAAVHSQEVFNLVTEVWAPFRLVDESTESGFSGIDIDVINELERRMNVIIKIESCPWARALDEIRSGEADLISGIAYTKDRAAFAEYIPVSYAAVEPVFYTQSGKGSSVVNYGDLAGKVIGMSRHSAYFEPYNSDNTLNKYFLDSEQKILDMLVLGRLDLGIGTNPNMAYDISVSGYQDKLELVFYKPPVATKLYLAMSKKSGGIPMLDEFSEALSDMTGDGTMESILEKYR
ncbi:MAG: transporter substrate-binding domain-containing protein [Spirochaetales bacterium]|nr:transporter substrate-binding domain-containing protein [Spirochaetales bacterium]